MKSNMFIGFFFFCCSVFTGDLTLLNVKPKPPLNLSVCPQLRFSKVKGGARALSFSEPDSWSSARKDQVLVSTYNCL